MSATTVERPVRRSGRWLPLMTILLAVGAVIVVHSPLMAIEAVEIVGAERADVAAVVDEIGLGPGAFLLWVNTRAVEEAVAAEPWVVDVRVDRIWPNRVVVEVLEYQAVAWIEGVLGWMLVSSDGTVLERAEEPGPGLLRAALAFPDRLPGDLPVDPAWHEIVEMSLVLSDDIGSSLTLELRGAEMWTSTFGHDVRLGHPIDLADKGRTLRAMLAEDLPAGVVIDVSSPLRPAIAGVDPQGVVETPQPEG